MQHFSQLRAAGGDHLFLRPPGHFDHRSPGGQLATALGATLYLPATRPHLADDLRRQFAAGVRSAVICLEDSIADQDVPAAQAHVVQQLGTLRADDEVPVLFVRVRSVEQVDQVARATLHHRVPLCGLVLPKFGSDNAEAYLDALAQAAGQRADGLWAMPVIETPQVLHRESRDAELSALREVLTRRRDQVLALRVGATDFSSVHGIRRPRDLTVHDVPLVAGVLADIMNHLGRQDGTGHSISGPVWEHFADQSRLFRPRLRQTLFEEQEASEIRSEIIQRDDDQLLREIALDKANGFSGKTVIHPSHVLPVHAMSAVSAEEWADAQDLLSSSMSSGGVRASAFGNKMNEARPHQAWARRTLLRGEAFGVLAEGMGAMDVMVEGLRQTGTG